MATCILSRISCRRAMAVMALALWAVGCQQSQPLLSHRLIEHQALIDFSGLKPAEVAPSVQTSLALPKQWETMPRKSTALYTHEQWRSPSGHTGVGIAFAHTPLPLSPQFVVWLAKREYSKQAKDGEVLSEWVDSLGRYWFEAANEKYHIRGYVVTHGFAAWIVYVGYRTRYAPDLGEISLAGRSLESAVPVFDDALPTTRPASGE